MTTTESHGAFQNWCASRVVKCCSFVKIGISDCEYQCTPINQAGLETPMRILDWRTRSQKSQTKSRIKPHTKSGIKSHIAETGGGHHDGFSSYGSEDQAGRELVRREQPCVE